MSCNTVHFWAKSLKLKGLFLRTSSLLFSAFLIRNSAIQPNLHWKHNLSSHPDGWLRVGRRLASHFGSANISWAPACARHQAEPGNARRCKVSSWASGHSPWRWETDPHPRLWHLTVLVQSPGSAVHYQESHRDNDLPSF